MWIVNYDRHYKYANYKSSTYKSKWFILAAIVYSLWQVKYILSLMPVKTISLYKTKNDVLFLEEFRKFRRKK